jgi:hypothetical protein
LIYFQKYGCAILMREELALGKLWHHEECY